MIKKSLKKIVFVLFLCSVLVGYNVFAADGEISGGIGSPSRGSGKKDGNGGGDGIHLRPVANGYRVTVVDSEGNRVKTADGTPSKSIDYWTYKVTANLSWENGGFAYMGYKALKNGPTVGAWWSSYYSLCPSLSSKTEDCTMSVYSNNSSDAFKAYLEQTAEDEFVSGTNFLGTDHTGGPENDTTDRVFNYNNGFIKHVYDKMRNEIEDETARNTGYQKFVNLIVNAGLGSDEQTNSQILQNFSDYYLLIEPVEAIVYQTNTNNLQRLYIGTFKEFYYREGIKYIFESGSTAEYKGSDVVYIYNYRSYTNPFAYYDGDSTLAGINKCDLDASNSNPIHWDNRRNIAKNGCLGVLVIRLSDIGNFQEDCTTTAANRITLAKEKADKSASNAKKEYYDYLVGKKDDSFDITDETYTDYYNTCFESYDSSKEDYGLDMNKCYQLSYEYVNNIGVDSSENLCAPTSCEKAVKMLNNKIKYEPVNYLYDEENNLRRYTDGVDVSDLTNLDYGLTNYDEITKYLYMNAKTFFPEASTAFLNYEMYQTLRTEASCSEALNCPITITDSLSCTPKNGKKLNKFSISDVSLESFEPFISSLTDRKSALKKCIENGYAYSDGMTGIQTNYNNEFDVQGAGDVVHRGYCEEKVEVNFPESPIVEENVTSTTKAGRLLAWGATNQTQYDGIYGGMVVERKCTYGASKTEYKKNINLSWIWDVNPDIRLYYSQNDISDEMEFPLHVELHTISVDTDVASYTVSEEDKEKKKFDCNNNTCSRTMTIRASYNIMYGNELKWFADKSNYNTAVQNSELIENNIVEVSDDEEIVPSEYVLLGYGLKTDFTAPTCPSLGTSNLGNSSDGDERGRLYVTVEHLGSKNGDGYTYHFDKAFSFGLKSDDATTDDGKRAGEFENKIVYSCPFSIENQLFGAENGKGSNDTCDIKPEGLDVVFRAVQLIDDSSEEKIKLAFPGRSGSGRYSENPNENEIGKNWSDLTPNAIFAVLNSKIYTQAEPMYHIELTPDKIAEIRANNLKFKQDQTEFEKGYDPYSYMGNLDSTPTYKFINLESKVLFSNYDKDGDGKITASDAQMLLMHCADNPTDDICGFGSSNAALKFYASYDLADSTEKYLYAHVASEFLSDLASPEKGWLDGTCMDVNNTESRAMKYYLTAGCYPKYE